MLPGVEFARKRRFYHRREAQSTTVLPEPKASSSALFRRPPPLESSSMSEEAALALLRLDEKLRGRAHRSSGRHPAPPFPFSSSTSSGRSRFHISSRETAPLRDVTRPPPPPPPPPPPEASVNGLQVVNRDRCDDKRGGAREEGRRSGTGMEVCAVCLEEVEGKQRVMWLPCSHKFHSDCVLPWLAAHPHCPCCRTPCSDPE